MMGEKANTILFSILAALILVVLSVSADYFVSYKCFKEIFPGATYMQYCFHKESFRKVNDD